MKIKTGNENKNRKNMSLLFIQQSTDNNTKVFDSLTDNGIINLRLEDQISAGQHDM